ncbi:MAG TPA: T9SS type A sorting domain-containing protein [Panacibacter sp.]|nr:T9SS type A sorting domain-containing protein [Panacibacter sp.]
MRSIFTVIMALLLCSTAMAQNTASLFLSDSTFARDAANSVAYDNAGNRYVAGWFAGTLSLSGTQYISSFGTTDDVVSTPLKGFISKYNNAGSLLWTKTFMGRGSQWCLDVEVNKTTGDCYVAGNFTTELLLDGVRQDFTDGTYFGRPFIAKFDANGNKQWINTTMSSYITNGSYSIGLSPNGNNLYWHSDFIGDLQLNGAVAYTSIGGDYVLMRVNTNTGAITSSLQTSDYLQDGYMLNCDNSGNVYWSGSHRHGGYVVSNPVYAIPQGYIVKYNASLTTQLWAFEVSGPGFQTVNATAVDSVGNVYIYGRFDDTTKFYNNSGTDQGVQFIPVPAKTNGYIAKVSKAGNLLWAKQFSGDYVLFDNYDADGEAALTVDSRNDVYFGGSFGGKFYFGTDSLYNTSTHNEPFLVKLTPQGNLSWMIKPETLHGGNMKGLAAYNTNVLAAGEITGIYNIYPDNYFKYGADSVGTDYNAQYLWEVADCSISINTSATSNTVNASNPDTLSVPAIPGATYQWYKNGNAIPGATSNVRITTKAGNYYCIIDNGPCQIQSRNKRITLAPTPFAAVSETDDVTATATAVNVYPNPVKDRFTLNIPATKNYNDYQARITDANGRSILSKKVNAGSQIIQLPRGTAPGLYLLQVTGGNETVNIKLLVQ